MCVACTYYGHVLSKYLTWVWKAGCGPALAPLQSFLDLCPSASSSSPQGPGWARPPGWAGAGHWANGKPPNPRLEGCTPDHSLLWQWHKLLCCARIWEQMMDGGLKGDWWIDGWIDDQVTILTGVGYAKHWIIGLDPCGMLCVRKAGHKSGKLHNTCKISAVFTCQRWQVSSCPPGRLVPLWCSSPERRRPYGWGAALDQSGPSRKTGTGEGTAEEWPPEYPSETQSEWSYLWWEEERVTSQTKKKDKDLVSFQWAKGRIHYIYIFLLNIKDWRYPWKVDWPKTPILPTRLRFHEVWKEY